MADWTGFALVTQPAAEPVSTAQLKAHLRLDNSDQDTMLAAIEKAARADVEIRLRRSLITQVWQVKYDDWPADGVLVLPRPPLVSVASIIYVDTDGDEQTVSSANYDVDIVSEPGRVTEAYGQTWPTARDQHNAITVQYTAGYGAAGSDVPEAILQAILMLGSDMYEHPDSQPELAHLKDNRTFKQLLAGYNVPEV